MSPKSPRILPNTSTMRILTKRFGSAASPSAAVAPVMPTETPHIRLQAPTVSPPQKMAKPDIHKVKSIPRKLEMCIQDGPVK